MPLHEDSFLGPLRAPGGGCGAAALAVWMPGGAFAAASALAAAPEVDMAAEEPSSATTETVITFFGFRSELDETARRECGLEPGAYGYVLRCVCLLLF